MTQRFKIRERRSKALFWIRAERSEPEIKKCYSGIGRYIVLAEMEKIRADLMAKHNLVDKPEGYYFDESEHFRITDSPSCHQLQISAQKGEKRVTRYYKNCGKDAAMSLMKDIRERLMYKHYGHLLFPNSPFF